MSTFADKSRPTPTNNHNLSHNHTLSLLTPVTAVPYLRTLVEQSDGAEDSLHHHPKELETEALIEYIRGELAESWRWQLLFANVLDQLRADELINDPNAIPTRCPYQLPERYGIPLTAHSLTAHTASQAPSLTSTSRAPSLTSTSPIPGTPGSSEKREGDVTLQANHIAKRRKLAE